MFKLIPHHKAAIPFARFDKATFARAGLLGKARHGVPGEPLMALFVPPAPPVGAGPPPGPALPAPPPATRAELRFRRWLRSTEGGFLSFLSDGTTIVFTVEREVALVRAQADGTPAINSDEFADEDGPFWLLRTKPTHNTANPSGDLFWARNTGSPLSFFGGRAVCVSAVFAPSPAPSPYSFLPGIRICVSLLSVSPVPFPFCPIYPPYCVPR